MRLIFFFLFLSSFLQSQTITANPNPFSSRVNICFTLTANDTVTLIIYNVSGQMVATNYSNTPLPAGVYCDTIHFDNQPDGVYFASLQTKQNGPKTIKLIKSLGTDISHLTDDADLLLFPSPVADYLYFKNLRERVFKLSVMTITGKVFLIQSFDEKEGHLDLSHIAAGIYYLFIETPDQRSIKKIVKMN